MATYQDIDNLTDIRASTLAFSDSDSDNILSRFTRDDVSALGPVVDNATTLTNKLQYLHKKEVRASLHGSTLAQYLRSKRIPRGLRVIKEPTIGRESGEFMEKWHAILNKCSFDLMLLIIQHVDCELVKIREELTEIETEMKDKLVETQLKEITAKCTELKDTYEKQIIETKMYKFRRDTLDYKHDRVFDWWKTDGQKSRNYNQDRRRNGGDFSASSGMSTDESGNEGLPPSTTTPKRGQRFLEPAPATGRYQMRARDAPPGGEASGTAHKNKHSRGRR